MQFVEIVLSVDPGHAPTRRAQVAALEQLIEQTDGLTYDELTWLEGELDTAHAVLGEG